MRIYSPTHGYLAIINTDKTWEDGTPVRKLIYTSDIARAEEWPDEMAAMVFIDAVRMFDSIHGADGLEVSQ